MGSAEIRFQAAGNEDRAFLYGLFAESRQLEFLPLGLPEPALRAMMDMQWRARDLGYGQSFPQALDRLILLDGRAVGRVLSAQDEQALHLVDLAVLQAFQRCGLGTWALTRLAEEARSAGLPLRLTVRSGNPARHLYARAGFHLLGSDGMNEAMELAV